jgi:hypothetical protein
MAKEFALSRLTGIILFFLFVILTGSLARFMPEKEDWAVLESADVKAVRGGASLFSPPGSSGGKTGNSGSTSSSSQTNIVLKNVPYVNQYVNPPQIRFLLRACKRVNGTR